MSNILTIFAPKFNEFGCDVVREYLSRSGGGVVHGLCTGPLKIKNNVTNILGDLCGELWHLESEEIEWISKKCKNEQLVNIEKELGLGTIGRMITADRRVGRGFVRGGICRPDMLANTVSKSSIINPENYVAGLYEFLDNLLKRINPDVVFIYAIAGMPALMLAEMAKARNILLTRLTPTRIKNYMIVDDDPLGLLSCVKRLYNDKNNMEIISRQREAHQMLISFRNSPDIPEYMIRNNAILSSSNQIKLLMDALIMTLKSMRGILSGKQNFIQNNSRVWWKVLIGFRRKSEQSQFNESAIIENKQFVYYPLHVDPEASTQVLSPYHTDQLYVIEMIAKGLPAGMCLVVKEHSPMVGLRPKYFYDQIKNMPRVILVGAENAGLNLIKRSTIVVVITGTAAWEAMRLGKPTVIIGNSPFLAIGEGVIYQPNLTKMTSALHQALHLNPTPDNFLIRYISALLVESFEMNSSLLWGNYLNHNSCQRTAATMHIVDGIMRRKTERNSLVDGH